MFPSRVEVSQQLMMHTLQTTRQPHAVRLAHASHNLKLSSFSSPNTQHTHTHTHTHSVSNSVEFERLLYIFLSTKHVGTCLPGESALCAREPLGVFWNSKPLLCVEQVDCKSCSRYPIPPKFQFQYEFIFQGPHDKLCVWLPTVHPSFPTVLGHHPQGNVGGVCVTIGFKRGLCNECVWNQHFDRLIHVFFTHAWYSFCHMVSFVL